MDVANLLMAWMPRELGWMRCAYSGLSEAQLEDVYGDSVLWALERHRDRPYATEDHLQGSIRINIRWTALAALRGRTAALPEGMEAPEVLQPDLGEDIALAEEFVRTLPDDEREALLLRMEGHGRAGVAKALGWSQRSAEGLLKRLEYKRKRFVQGR